MYGEFLDKGIRALNQTQGPFEYRAYASARATHRGGGPGWWYLCPELVSPPQ